LNIWLRKNGCKYKKRHAGTFFSQETWDQDWRDLTQALGGGTVASA
jgi:hypothetical protein